MGDVDPMPTGTPPAAGEALPEGEEAAPPGTRAMGAVRWALVVLMAAAAIGAWAHYAHERGWPRTGAAALLRCPMHPAVVQDRPGDCPICGMDLVAADASGANANGGSRGGEQRVASSAAPRSGGKYGCPMHPEVTSDAPDATCSRCGGMRLQPRAPAKPESAGGVPGLVPIELGGERRQLIGMRTATAARRTLGQRLRTVGFVSADERRVAVVTARSSGWIEELRVAQSGARVKSGEILLTLYSGEVVSAQQAYLNAVRWKQNLAATPAGQTPAAQAIDRDPLRRLQLYGVAEVDIAALERRGEPATALPVRSPISGWVARKSVLPGQFVAAGSELYQIADLTTVWVVAELLEQDAGRVAVGQKARLAIGAYPGASFEGRVDFVYPALNPESRTLEARMEFKNPGLRLRPGMYGEVFVEAPGTEALVIPAEAVVDTGELQYVFVARGEGRYDPRVVTTGARRDGQIEIVSGLEAGDEVVTTANFYVDAESRLRAGVEGRAAAEPAGGTPP